MSREVSVSVVTVFKDDPAWDSLTENDHYTKLGLKKLGELYVTEIVVTGSVPDDVSDADIECSERANCVIYAEENYPGHVYTYIGKVTQIQRDLANSKQ